MVSPQAEFQDGGADFISFNFSPSPPPPTTTSSEQPPPSSAGAGPSKLPPPPSTLPPKPGAASSRDIATAYNGKRKAEVSEAMLHNLVNKKSKTEQEKKDRQKGKGKGRQNGRNDDDGDTGPKNLKEERRAAERHAPWSDLVDWDRCRDPAEMLNEEINAFYKYVSPTRAEFEVRLFVIEMITRAIAKLWPDAEVTPFGSWQTQLYLPQGDIDLVVTHKHFSEANKARLLTEMAKSMRMANITSTVAIISRARVPIIKFVTNEGKLNVDISLNQVNGISASKIINQYLDALPGARQLILVVKSFLSQRSMNEVYSGGLGSYSVICMVISFLQVHPKLRRSEMDPEENLGTLLVEFFELYGRHFNYQEVGLSIRRGGFYYLKSSRGWLRPNQSFLLSIEDPQDRDNDISGGSFGIRQVKATLAGAYELLLMRLFERAEVMSGRASGRKPRDLDPDEMSILTGVMGITKETLRQRIELDRLHAEGKLQRLLGIPLDADPRDYVSNYRPPPDLFLSKDRDEPRAKASPSSRTGRPTETPRRETRSRSNGGVQAIIVDDDEIDDDSMSDSDSEYDRYEPDEESFINDISLVESGEEDGEIVEVFPNGRSTVLPPKTDTPGESGGHSASAARIAATSGSRDMSRNSNGYGSDVSEDIIEILDEPPEESRYAFSKKRSSKKSSKAASSIAMDEVSLDDSDLDDLTSGEDQPPQIEEEEVDGEVGDDRPVTEVSQTMSGKSRSNGNGTSNGVRGKERRAFWAAKAGLAGGRGDDFDDDAAFVGLD
ncbi:hypothetical protein IAR55_006122 [Kwoniella newhampshirensis]|uniref:polynucleotide adenylyltransferase n=1 Tax=Kwoniella newhampshirensis TaxID=1651941 RepID=A0AAW0YJT9_9TREE